MGFYIFFMEMFLARVSLVLPSKVFKELPMNTHNKNRADCSKIAEVFSGSNYHIHASGLRDVGKPELVQLINIIRFSDLPSIQEKLDSLFKYNPDTILMNKASQENGCPEFNPECCDCFLPDISQENCFCMRSRAEYLAKTDYRNTPEYEKWRRSVFERDEYTCQKCGVVGGDLNAHHIKKFKDYPENRYEIENGKTLCVSCHKKEHRTASA